ncbi:AAA family ATPase [uncultured Varibaculum sp.]|uniref:ATP-dependent nuclease n=1 Tax=uncultured Varibaculum sp. TaxID=413896 RepID=UPI0028061844|nr:AAA family ATPase [uncultured Varibaculum sp.]
MITKVRIRGYRKFRDFEFLPDAGMNILVGGNEAGKSTLLEAITMALTGRVNGVYAGEILNPYWFNQKLLDEFFDQIEKKSNGTLAYPEFRIDVHLEVGRGELEKMRGINNLSNEDSVGLSIIARPDPEYLHELEEYFKQDDCPCVLPIEYYRLDWQNFAGMTVLRRPKDLSVAVIDTRTIRSDRGMDYYTKQLLEDRLDARVRNQVSVEHRKMRAQLGDSVLESLNESLRRETDDEDVLGIGIQVDQSRSTSWTSTLIPEIDKIPFSLAGQGAQAYVKTALALGRSSDTSGCILIEEPENHLSHTRLRELLAYIETARGDRQVFVTTHSSYVLNRLGLSQLTLLAPDGLPRNFNNLSKGTSEYFRKLSGFDTLRLILADHIVLVEGPSDEIVFNRFFKDRFDKEPLDFGVDVMSVGGVSFRRGFELASLMKRPLVALRDNDSKEPAHWQQALGDYRQKGVRDLFVGSPSQGFSLEEQILKANDDSTLRTALDLGTSQEPLDWMTANKTEAALRIAEFEGQLNPPPYISDALSTLAKRLGKRK